MACLLLIAGHACADNKANPLVTLGSVDGAAGQVTALPVSYAPAGAAVETSTLVLKVAWTAGWITLAGVSATSALAPAGKTFDFEPHDNSVTIVIYGGKNPLPQAELVYLNFLVDPLAMPVNTAAVFDAGSNASDADGNAVALSIAGGAVTVTVGPTPHSADYDGDYHISLSELLRIIQFYNIGAMHCDATTEDGYAPGPGDQTCAPHNTDYSPADWKIALDELLRMIQFYNAPGGYHLQPGSEDGFAPGEWVPY